MPSLLAKFFWKGLRLGVGFQLAIGPVFVFIVNTALVADWGPLMGAVLGVTLVDALYIGLASMGVNRLLEGTHRRRLLEGLSALVLIAFGLHFLWGAWQNAPLSFHEGEVPNNLAGLQPFVYAVLLTGSSPLTIVFWTGVFTAYETELNPNRAEHWALACGCVFATFLVLSLLGLGAQWFTYVLSPRVITGLNALVGLALIGFGLRKGLVINNQG